ncbi:leucine-rich repeat protein [Paramuribaculum intestinale]|uniref:leucine-rich repeat protein n=1 Tax=Paramuribaculum intestinale TaxID=2094151 RepID=UPI0025B4C45F|nr:leucine-rich repeat protein [Paramuribaculum intestinale]
MKKKFIGTGTIRKVWIACSMVCACMFGLSSCGDDYDDSELRGDIENLEDRITALEEWQKSVNTDIRSLQSLVAALENKDYVTAVTPLEDGTGYVISFLKSGNVTIKHGERGEQGEKGEDGTTPVISVKPDTDGKYYWTVNGEWLLDNGNKMPVTGEKGDKGDKGDKAPQVRINTDTNEWEISTDGGTTWASTGVKATGNKGNTGAQGEKGDSMFSSIDNSNEAYVELTLADGVTKIKMPKYAAFSIAFESDEVFYASPTENELTLVLPATLKESDYRSITATITATNGADVQTRSTGSQWSVTVTKPTFGTDGALVEGSAKVAIRGTENTHLADTYLLRVALVAANGTEVTASRLVRYFDGAIVESQSDITDNTVKRLAWKGDMAETDFEYIRNNMSSTLEVLDLSATTLTELPTRALAFYSSMGLSDNKTLKEVILPDGLTTIGNSAFAMCKALYKLNIPSTVTTLGRWILEGAGLTSFVIPDGATLSESTFYGSSIVEIRIPTTMTEIPAYCFTECKNLERIFLHDDISNIGKEAFFNCYALKSFTAPRSLTVLSDALFYNCESLSRVTLHDGITEFGTECFTFCTSLRELITNKDDENDSYLAWPKALQTMGETVFANSGLEHVSIARTKLTEIPAHAFESCGNLSAVSLPLQVEKIGNQAFKSTAIPDLELPATTKELGSSVFSGCKNLWRIVCKAITAPTIQANTFPDEFKTQCTTLYYPENADYSSWMSYFSDTVKLN